MTPNQKAWEGKWSEADDSIRATLSFIRESKEVSHQDEDGFYSFPKCKRTSGSVFIGLIGVGMVLGDVHLREVNGLGLTIVEEYELSKCDPSDPRIFTGYILRGSDE